MTREISFRCWDTEAKEMRETAMLRWEDGRMSRIAGYWPGTRNNGWTDYDPADGKYILMQFTGLKDKNGKEIYEGDCFVWGIHHCEIVWDKDGFGARNQQGLILGLYTTSSQGEIVGNIYENPELLKV